MAQKQLIRRRIRSVSNTRQITKAMELVSASKLRRSQEATFRSRTYTDAASEILARLSGLTDAAKHPLFARRDGGRKLVIVFASDRTLAGAYNNNMAKLLTAEAKSTANLKVLAVGNQIARFASRLPGVELIGAYSHLPTELTSVQIWPMVETAIELFTAASVDEVVVLYTKFVSGIIQTPTRQRLLPATIDGAPAKSTGIELADAVFEPSAAAVLTAMMPRLVEAQVLGAALSAVASEHSMRMLAMKNASDNAGDIIDDLTLAYNSARQAGITQELAEITGGAAAIS